MLFSLVPTKASCGMAGDLREIAALFRGPIEHDHRGRDLRQTSDLALLIGLQLLENEACLRIDRDAGLGGAERRRPTQGQRQKQGHRRRSTKKNEHGGQNRCTLTGRLRLATAIIRRMCAGTAPASPTEGQLWSAHRNGTRQDLAPRGCARPRCVDRMESRIARRCRESSRRHPDRCCRPPYRIHR